jgi:predicted DsbA family dithiol-disulfide isomerase
LERLEQSYPVSVHWRSFELRPRGAPPIPAEYRAKIEAGRPRLYAIAREQYGVELNPGPFEFDSRPALVGAKYAERLGVGPEFHAAAMHAHWQQARRLDDLAVLAELAESVGLERAAFLAALQDPELEAAVLADIAQAQAYGLTGVLALVFANKYLIPGAQPYAVLAQAVEQIQQELNQSA